MDAIKYVASLCPNDGMLSYQGRLPFHWFCHSRALKSDLEWWFEKYPTLASAQTIDTQELPLHIYLYYSGTEDYDDTIDEELQNCDDGYLSAVKFLTEKHEDAVNFPNRLGWLPVHVAFLQNAPMDVVFYFVSRNPRHWCPSP